MDDSRTDHLEDLRQLEHFLPLGFAFLLPFIAFSTILLLALFSVIYAVFISPRLIPSTTRPDERKRGFSPGKLSYAISVLLLILIFKDDLHIAAATWGILAAGDSISNVIGRRFEEIRLPYNPAKTIPGIISFGITGSIVASILLAWNLGSASFSFSILLLFSIITAFVCAFFESLPSPIDDNIIICWVGGSTFALLFSLNSSFRAGGDWRESLLINALVAAASLWLGWLSGKGTLLALVMGFIVYTSLGHPAYLALVIFLIISSVATRAGLHAKQARRIAQSMGGRRGAINVVSNGLVPFGAAVFAFWSDQELLLVIFLSAVATATIDTVSTEIGQWLGHHPIDMRTLQPTVPGASGAMSIEGTLAGLAAGSLVILVAVLTAGLPLAILTVSLVSGFVSSTAESIFGSFSREDIPFKDEVLNLYNTFLGSFLGGIFWLLL